MDNFRIIEEDLIDLSNECSRRFPAVSEATELALLALRAARDGYITHVVRGGNEKDKEKNTEKKGLKAPPPYTFYNSSDLLAPYLLLSNYNDISSKLISQCMNSLLLLAKFNMISPSDVPHLLRILLIQVSNNKCDCQLKILQLTVQLATLLAQCDVLTEPEFITELTDELDNNIEDNDNNLSYDSYHYNNLKASSIKIKKNNEYFTEQTLLSFLSLTLSLSESRFPLSLTTASLGTTRQIIAIVLERAERIYNNEQDIINNYLKENVNKNYLPVFYYSTKKNFNDTLTDIKLYNKLYYNNTKNILIIKPSSAYRSIMYAITLIFKEMSHIMMIQSGIPILKSGTLLPTYLINTNNSCNNTNTNLSNSLPNISSTSSFSPSTLSSFSLSSTSSFLTINASTFNITQTFSYDVIFDALDSHPNLFVNSINSSTSTSSTPTSLLSNNLFSIPPPIYLTLIESLYPSILSILKLSPYESIYQHYKYGNVTSSAFIFRVVRICRWFLSYLPFHSPLSSCITLPLDIDLTESNKSKKKSINFNEPFEFVGTDNIQVLVNTMLETFTGVTSVECEKYSLNLLNNLTNSGSTSSSTTSASPPPPPQSQSTSAASLLSKFVSSSITNALGRNINSSNTSDKNQSASSSSSLPSMISSGTIQKLFYNETDYFIPVLKNPYVFINMYYLNPTNLTSPPIQQYQEALTGRYISSHLIGCCLEALNTFVLMRSASTSLFSNINNASLNNEVTTSSLCKTNSNFIFDKFSIPSDILFYLASKISRLASQTISANILACLSNTRRDLEAAFRAPLLQQQLDLMLGHKLNPIKQSSSSTDSKTSEESFSLFDDNKKLIHQFIVSNYNGLKQTEVNVISFITINSISSTLLRILILDRLRYYPLTINNLSEDPNNNFNVTYDDVTLNSISSCLLSSYPAGKKIFINANCIQNYFKIIDKHRSLLPINENILPYDIPSEPLLRTRSSSSSSVESKGFTSSSLSSSILKSCEKFYEGALDACNSLLAITNVSTSSYSVRVSIAILSDLSLLFGLLNAQKEREIVISFLCKQALPSSSPAFQSIKPPANASSGSVPSKNTNSDQLNTTNNNNSSSSTLLSSRHMQVMTRLLHVTHVLADLLTDWDCIVDCLEQFVNLTITFTNNSQNLSSKLGEDVKNLLRSIDNLKFFTLCLSDDSVVRLMTSLVALSMNNNSNINSLTINADGSIQNIVNNTNDDIVKDFDISDILKESKLKFILDKDNDQIDSDNLIIKYNNKTTSYLYKYLNNKKLSLSLKFVVEITKINSFRISAYWQMVNSHLKMLTQGTKSTLSSLRIISIISLFDIIDAALDHDQHIIQKIIHNKLNDYVIMKGNTLSFNLLNNLDPINSIVNNDIQHDNQNTFLAIFSSIFNDNLIWNTIFPDIENLFFIPPLKINKNDFNLLKSNYHSDASLLPSHLTQSEIFTNLKSIVINTRNPDVQLIILKGLNSLVENNTNNMINSEGLINILEILSSIPLSLCDPLAQFQWITQRENSLSNVSPSETIVSTPTSSFFPPRRTFRGSEVSYMKDILNLCLPLSSENSTGFQITDKTHNLILNEFFSRSHTLIPHNFFSSNSNVNSTNISLPTSITTREALSEAFSTIQILLEDPSFYNIDLNFDDMVENLFEASPSLATSITSSTLTIEEQLTPGTRSLISSLARIYHSLEALYLFSSQRVDINIALSSAELIWKINDRIMKSASSSTSSINAVISPRPHLLLITSLPLRHLQLLSLDPRAEIRHCATHSLVSIISIINTHHQQFQHNQNVKHVPSKLSSPIPSLPSTPASTPLTSPPASTSSTSTASSILSSITLDQLDNEDNEITVPWRVYFPLFIIPLITQARSRFIITLANSQGLVKNLEDYDDEIDNEDIFGDELDYELEDVNQKIFDMDQFSLSKLNENSPNPLTEINNRLLLKYMLLKQKTDDDSNYSVPMLKKGVKMNVHHSRDTAHKQWAETCGLLLQGLLKVLKSCVKQQQNKMMSSSTSSVDLSSSTSTTSSSTSSSVNLDVVYNQIKLLNKVILNKQWFYNEIWLKSLSICVMFLIPRRHWSCISYNSRFLSIEPNFKNMPTKFLPRGLYERHVIFEYEVQQHAVDVLFGLLNLCTDTSSNEEEDLLKILKNFNTPSSSSSTASNTIKIVKLITDVLHHTEKSKQNLWSSSFQSLHFITLFSLHNSDFSSHIIKNLTKYYEQRKHNEFRYSANILILLNIIEQLLKPFVMIVDYKNKDSNISSYNSSTKQVTYLPNTPPNIQLKLTNSLIQYLNVLSSNNSSKNLTFASSGSVLNPFIRIIRSFLSSLVFTDLSSLNSFITTLARIAFASTHSFIYLPSNSKNLNNILHSYEEKLMMFSAVDINVRIELIDTLIAIFSSSTTNTSASTNSTQSESINSFSESFNDKSLLYSSVSQNLLGLNSSVVSVLRQYFISFCAPSIVKRISSLLSLNLSDDSLVNASYSILNKIYSTDPQQITIDSYLNEKTLGLATITSSVVIPIVSTSSSSSSSTINFYETELNHLNLLECVSNQLLLQFNDLSQSIKKSGSEILISILITLLSTSSSINNMDESSPTSTSSEGPFYISSSPATSKHPSLTYKTPTSTSNSGNNSNTDFSHLYNIIKMILTTPSFFESSKISLINSFSYSLSHSILLLQHYILENKTQDGLNNSNKSKNKLSSSYLSNLPTFFLDELKNKFNLYFKILTLYFTISATPLPSPISSPLNSSSTAASSFQHDPISYSPNYRWSPELNKIFVLSLISLIKSISNLLALFFTSSNIFSPEEEEFSIYFQEILVKMIELLNAIKDSNMNNIKWNYDDLNHFLISSSSSSTSSFNSLVDEEQKWLKCCLINIYNQENASFSTSSTSSSSTISSSLPYYILYDSTIELLFSLPNNITAVSIPSYPSPTNHITVILRFLLKNFLTSIQVNNFFSNLQEKEKRINDLEAELTMLKKKTNDVAFPF